MRMATSNLAMRFYKSDGWTREILEKLVIRTGRGGEAFHYWDDPNFEYWIPNVGTNLNLDELLKIVTRVDRAFNDYPNESDREFLKRFNW